VAQIRSLTEARDAQASDTLYGLSYQAEIDSASTELAAWRLSPREMADAEDAIRAATRRFDRAQTGRSRGPVIAGVTGTVGAAATAGHLVADPSGLPVIGGGLLVVAALALVLTVRDRARDSAVADQAAADLTEAQDRYMGLVADHSHVISPYRAALPTQQEEPCSPHTESAAPTTGTTPPAADPALALTSSGAATGGPPPTGSPTSASSGTASAA
jgi:hypothetical protein